MIVTGIQDPRRPESRKSLEERKQGRRRGDKSEIIIILVL